MKKFLAIFLVLTLLFSFAACNNDKDVTNGDDTTSGQDTEQTAGNEESTSKKPRPETTTAAPFENPNLTEPSALFKIIDVNDYEFKSGKPNTTASSGVTFIAKRYENKNAAQNTLPAQINTEGTDFVLNETLLKDFIAKGWTITSKNDANTAIEAGKDTSVLLKNSQGKTTKLVVTNKNSTSMALADCVITEIGILKTITEQDWAEFTIDGNANTSSSTYADFINAFGEPKSINVAEYYKGNDYTHAKVTLMFEKVVNNQTWSLSITVYDENGKATIESGIYEVK